MHQNIKGMLCFTSPGGVRFFSHRRDSVVLNIYFTLNAFRLEYLLQDILLLNFKFTELQ
jgi:hypothetical protein